jgi:hypothetical protein
MDFVLVGHRREYFLQVLDYIQFVLVHFFVLPLLQALLLQLFPLLLVQQLLMQLLQIELDYSKPMECWLVISFSSEK